MGKSIMQFLTLVTLAAVATTSPACPATDVVVLLGASSSWKEQFGAHPHGFDAMVEMLRDWVNGVSLTGEEAGTTNSPSPTSGLRIGFVQFSSYPITAPDTIGTRGRLSGDVNELDADLTWHASKFLSGGYFISLARDKAESMFAAADPTGLRRRVLLVIVDSSFEDTSALFTTRIPNVETFGVIVRRQAELTSADTAAEFSLQTILSEPQADHTRHVQIDEVGAVLDAMCVPAPSCPATDAVVLLSGSSTWKKQFGAHPHGFDAMIEMLRDWVKAGSLTGEGAGVTSSGANPTSGLRIGFVQFATVPLTTPDKTGTGGRLSGEMNELDADLTWHQGNFISDENFVAFAMGKVESMFAAADPAGLRRRVLLVVVDSSFEDTSAAIAERMPNVETFGIVVRRQAELTSADTAAEFSLQTILSEPEADHVRHIQIDEVGAVLDAICSMC